MPEVQIKEGLHSSFSPHNYSFNYPTKPYVANGTTYTGKRNKCDKRQLLVVFTKLFVYVNLDKRVVKPCTGNAEYRLIRTTSLLYSAEYNLIALISLPRISNRRLRVLKKASH